MNDSQFTLLYDRVGELHTLGVWIYRALCVACLGVVMLCLKKR